MEFKMFFLSILPVNINGFVTWSWSKFWLQSFSVVLVAGIVYKWFFLKDISSAEIISISGYILGTGWLRHRSKVSSENENGHI